MGRSAEEPDLSEPGLQRPLQHTCQVPHSGILFQYLKDRGGSDPPSPTPPFNSSFNSLQIGRQNTLYTHMLSVLRVLGLKNASKFDPIKNSQMPKLHF